MTFETDDIVETTTTENNSVEVETEQTQEDGEGQPIPGEQPEGEEGKKLDDPEKPIHRSQKRVKQALERAAIAEQKLAEYEAKQNASAQIQDEPKLEDFEDYNEWQKAVRQHDREQIKKEMLAEIGQKESQKTLAQRQSEFEIAMVELESEGIDGLALTKKLETLPPLPIDLNHFGLGAKETLSLAAELIGNDELWLDLSQMNPTQAAMRIGQEIGRKNAKPAAPKIPNAPKPIKPVKANAPIKRDINSMSDGESVAYLKNLKKGK